MEREYLFALVEKAIQGDQQAFSELYECQAKRILYHAMRLLSNRQEAEDAAQEVVLGMYRNIGTLREPKLFNVWLHSIIVNTCNMMMRKKYTRGGTLNIEDFEGCLWEERPEFLPQEYAENAELRSRVLHIVENLPEKYRDTVFMYYYEGLSYAEIALVTQKPINTVSTNLARAKQRIRRELERKAGRPLATAQSAAAIPVLQRVFESDADHLFSSDSIHQFVLACRNLLETSPLASTATAATAKSLGFLFVLKVFAIVLTGTAVLTTSIVYAAQPVDPQHVSTGFLSPLPYGAPGSPQPTGFPGRWGAEYDRILGSGEEGALGQALVADNGNGSPEPSIPEGGISPSPSGTQSNLLPISESALVSDGSVQPLATPLSGYVSVVDKTGKPSTEGTNYTAGLGITLLDNQGAMVSQTTVASDGSFAFQPLSLSVDSKYTLRLELPAGGWLAATGNNPKGDLTVQLTPGVGLSDVVLQVTYTQFPDGYILLSGGDCACGHLNPKKAVLVEPTIPGQQQTWEILSSNGRVVYTGTGSVITTELQALINSGAEGIYTIRFVSVNAFGHGQEVKLQIQIYTGPIDTNLFA